MLLTTSWVVDLSLCLITALFLLYKYVYRHNNYWADRNVPFIEPKPIFGNFLDMAAMKKTSGEYLKDMYNSIDNPFFGIFIFNKPVLVVRSPELIKSVLVKDFQYFSDRTVASYGHEPLVSNMLFLSKNPDWKVLRKVLTPVFTSGKLKSMFPMIDNIGRDMSKYIDQHLGQGTLEAKEICAKFATDVIAKCAFAINAHSFDRDNADFRRHGKSIFDFSLRNAVIQTSFFFFPQFVKAFKLRFLSKETNNFLNDVFWAAVKTREASNVKGNDVIDCIVDLRKNKQFVESIGFKDEKVVAQAAQFFIAGFETTSSTIAFTLYELCIHTDIQKKLREEIVSTIKKHGSFTYDAIIDMKYLHMCVSETLRMYPVLPFLDRTVMQDYKIPGTDVVIEKGTAVYVPMFGLHYDPNYFPNPHKYIPERFSEEAVNNLTAYSYIPFGEGPRNCIGERFGLLATKLGVVHILMKYELLKTEETPVPLVFEPKSFVLASKVGLPMKFKKI